MLRHVVANMAIVLAVFVGIAPGAVAESWIRSFDSGVHGGDTVRVVAADSASNLYTLVEARPPQSGYAADRSFSFLQKQTSRGDIAWTKKFDFGLTTRSLEVRVDGNDDVVVAVHVYLRTWRSRYGTEFDTATYVYKFRGRDGAYLWGYAFNYRAGEDLFGVCHIDGASNVYVAGSTQERSNAAKRGLLFKLGPNGGYKWGRALSTYRGAPPALVIDRAGDYFMTSNREVQTEQLSVSKYRGATGARLWTSRSMRAAAFDPMFSASDARIRYSDLRVLPNDQVVLLMSSANWDAPYHWSQPPVANKDKNGVIVAVQFDSATGVEVWPQPFVLDPSPGVNHETTTPTQRDCTAFLTEVTGGQLVISAIASDPNAPTLGQSDTLFSIDGQSGLLAWSNRLHDGEFGRYAVTSNGHLVVLAGSRFSTPSTPRGYDVRRSLTYFDSTSGTKVADYPYNSQGMWLEHVLTRGNGIWLAGSIERRQPRTNWDFVTVRLR